MDLSAKELAHYMAPGWNLGNTLEAGSNANVFTNNGGVKTETSWQSTKTTKEFITKVKESGFRSVRIPASWVMGHLTDATTMTIDQEWMARVKEVVDYCIEANLYVVLNDHWDGGWLEHDGFTTGADVDTKKEQLRKLWTNIATAFKDYDQRLLFAGLNEPGVGGKSPNVSGELIENWSKFSARLLEYEQVFIDAVRATGGNNARRVLIVQGPKTDIALTNTYYDITKLTDTATDRLMLEVHHYDPYLFCGMTKDEEWGSMYYYWYGHAPKRVDSKRVAPQSVETAITTSMQTLKTKFVDKGFPVIIGEYGANHRQLLPAQQANHDESLAYWYQFSTEAAYENGLIPFVWDTNNQGRPNMTIFNRSGLTISDKTAYDGIFAGDEAGRASYNSVYPEPSTTSTGISMPSQTNNTETAIFDLSGRKVAASATGLQGLGLAKGVYVYGGKKIVVK